MPHLQRGSWDKVSTCTNSYLQVFPHILVLRSLGERERSNIQCAAQCKEEGTLHKILVLPENQLKLACALWFLLAKASLKHVVNTRVSTCSCSGTVVSFWCTSLPSSLLFPASYVFISITFILFFAHPSHHFILNIQIPRSSALYLK